MQQTPESKPMNPTATTEAAREIDKDFLQDLARLLAQELTRYPEKHPHTIAAKAMRKAGGLFSTVKGWFRR